MRYSFLLPILIMALLACAGCGEKDAPSKPPTPPDTGEEERPDAVGRGFLVEVIEEHHDDLPGPLADFLDALETPFVLHDGRIVVYASPETLPPSDEEEVALASPEAEGRRDEPLAACRLFVIHRIRFEGGGRADEDRRFFAFLAPEAAIDLGGWAGAGDRFVHDPAKAGPPFEIAIRDIRLLGESGGRLELAAGPEALKATLDGSSTTIEAGGRAELHEEARTLTVESKPLTREAVDPGEFSADVLPAVLRPGRTFGPVKFRSRLTVVFHGELPVERGSSGESGGER